MSSQNTANSIYACQNDSFLLKCQLAQRNEYSRAKKVAKVKAVLTFLFAAFSVISAASGNDILSALSSLFAVVLLVFNKYSEKRIRFHREHAASIQQYIDVTLFASAIGGTKAEWGEIPNLTDLSKTISENADTDVSSVKDWYSDYSSLPGANQVFCCQRENIRWNYNLHKAYNLFQLTFLLIVMIVILAILFTTNPKFINSLCVLAWLTPIGEYVYSNYTEINDSIKMLENIDALSDKIEKDISYKHTIAKDQLIALQYKIRERRATGYLIPDWFYQRGKNEQQKQEDKIANTLSGFDDNANDDEVTYK